MERTCRVSLRSRSSPGLGVCAAGSCGGQRPLRPRTDSAEPPRDPPQEEGSQASSSWHENNELTQSTGLWLSYCCSGFCSVFSHPHQFPTTLNGTAPCPLLLCPQTLSLPPVTQVLCRIRCLSPLISFSASAYCSSLQLFPGNVQTQGLTHFSAFRNHKEGRPRLRGQSVSPTVPENLHFSQVPAGQWPWKEG